MERNNKHGRGKKFNKSKFDGNTTKRYKTEIQPEQLSEDDVGIAEYVSELEGFSGILKARFSDFQVNEINKVGEIAKFTNTTEPEGFDSNSLKKEIIIPQETPSADIPQDIWTEILGIIDNNEDKVVELDSTSYDKEKRGNVHRTVKSILEKKIIASTIIRDDGRYITFKRYNKDDKLEQRFNWPVDKGEYVYFLVYKENIDTLETALKISDCLRMKTSLFNYAGVKDRRAKTTQWFSVRKVEPWKLLKKTRCLRNIHVGNITFKNQPLKLGKLQGNRFRIALRNISAEDNLINKAMQNLEKRGFINYYGLQRFGNDKEVPTYEIGIKLLLGQFREACNLILKCKKCDNPNAEISKAKQHYSEMGNADSAINIIKGKESNTIESKLLQGLAKSNINDYVNALENVPRNMRLLYIHSFQALIWNKIVSRRIKEFGLYPVVGDLVLLKDDETSNSENNEIETEESSEIEVEHDKTDGNDNDENTDTVRNKKKNVKILTEKDLENYSIYDVVLPMPGYDITYPENVVKEWYKEILEGYGLSLEMTKQSVKTYTLSGAYRFMLGRVTNLSWNVMHYKDPSDDLIRSDFEEFLNKPAPVDQPDGQYKALIVDFCLNSSSYATMAVREILKTDTSSSAHAKLNDYHAKKIESENTIECPAPTSLLADPIKKIEFQKAVNSPVVNSLLADPAKKIEPETTIDSPAPNSLFADPAKYEDFKKLIFGNTDSDNSLKRKVEDENVCVVPEKKSKEDTKDEKSGFKLEPALV